jgi:hypothetical protein
MTRIETIPQEATDLAVHVALCAQRHAEVMTLLDEARSELARLRGDLQRIGIWVVIASGGISTAPYIASAIPVVLRAIGL